MSMPTLIIFGVWTSLDVILLFCWVRNIDEEHLKCKNVWCSQTAKFSGRITFPQLVPTIAFLLTVNLIGPLKIIHKFMLYSVVVRGLPIVPQLYHIYDKFHIAGRPGIEMPHSHFIRDYFSGHLQNNT